MLHNANRQHNYPHSFKTVDALYSIRHFTSKTFKHRLRNTHNLNAIDITKSP